MRETQRLNFSQFYSYYNFFSCKTFQSSERKKEEMSDVVCSVCLDAPLIRTRVQN